MNKHIKRVLCLAVCLTAVFATSCDLLLESLPRLCPRLRPRTAIL